MSTTGRKSNWLTSATTNRLLFASSSISLIGFVMTCVVAVLDDARTPTFRLSVLNTAILICVPVLALGWVISQLFTLIAMIVYTKRRDNWSAGVKLLLIILQTFLSALVSPAIYFLAYRPEFFTQQTIMGTNSSAS